VCIGFFYFIDEPGKERNYVRGYTELLYEERWDEKKQKERRNEAAFFSPESPITREIPIEELFDVLDAGVWAYQTRYNSEALVHSFFEQIKRCSVVKRRRML